MNQFHRTPIAVRALQLRARCPNQSAIADPVIARIVRRSLTDERLDVTLARVGVAAEGRMTHRWSEPDREVWATYRTCARCGMLKVTRLEDRSPWHEYMQGGVLLDTPGGRVPKCEPAAAEQRAAA